MNEAKETINNNNNKSLRILYNQYLAEGVLPDFWNNPLLFN